MSELTQEIEKEEGMYVYDKKIECPVCMKEFTTKIVKTGKADLRGVKWIYVRYMRELTP